MHLLKTIDIVTLIGSPFLRNERKIPSEDFLLKVYDKAFKNRVAPLYLNRFYREDWSSQLKGLYAALRERENMTLNVLSDVAANLNAWNKHGYVIFKSIKSYPAIPNDTDVLIFGGKKEFNSALEYLYYCGYIFHEWAPLQTTLYDSRGWGKTGTGKKGGTYYIDVYQQISTDYVCYLSEKAIKPLVITKQIHGVDVNLLRPEPELSIILFHNVFPERTFQLEHFYMPLYNLSDPKFDIDLFVRFTEKNRLTCAVIANLSLVERMHQECFGFVPRAIAQLLDSWGRNCLEAERIVAAELEVPYLFTARTFFGVIFGKMRDVVFRQSLFIQALHMLNPIIFLEVIKTLKRRFSERGVYHLE